MTPAQAHLVDQLRARFGPKVALTDPADIAPWLTDWRGRWHGASPALLQPDSVEAVAAIVALARERRRRARPRRAATARWSAARRRPPTARR